MAALATLRRLFSHALAWPGCLLLGLVLRILLIAIGEMQDAAAAAGAAGGVKYTGQ